MSTTACTLLIFGVFGGIILIPLSIWAGYRIHEWSKVKAEKRRWERRSNSQPDKKEPILGDWISKFLTPQLKWAPVAVLIAAVVIVLINTEVRPCHEDSKVAKIMNTVMPEQIADCGCGKEK